MSWSYELRTRHKANTWKIQPLPKEKKAIRCRSVFKVNIESDGSLEKYKARLVIKWYS